ncbi:hypothetical protein FS842_004018 [Serendipita sp. 407]|nr:hypothetical protein FS842_004018 [Serendipita sp. 407]
MMLDNEWDADWVIGPMDEGKEEATDEEVPAAITPSPEEGELPAVAFGVMRKFPPIKYH